jgi:succinate dehydrogenase/fumarate reductase-like Fe-S protein
MLGRDLCFLHNSDQFQVRQTCTALVDRLLDPTGIDLRPMSKFPSERDPCVDCSGHWKKLQPRTYMAPASRLTKQTVALGLRS